MDFTVNEIGDVRAVRITGNLDTQTTPVAQQQLIQLIDNGATKILVDFEQHTQARAADVIEVLEVNQDFCRSAIYKLYQLFLGNWRSLCVEVS